MAEREQREPEGSGPEEPGLGSTQRDLSRDQTIRPGGRTKKRDDLGSGPTFRPKRTDSKAGDLDSDPTLRGRSPGPQRGGARELMEQERQVGRQTGDKVFGRYELRKVLGRGGMGIVWLATDLELHREVALKFLPDALAYNEGALADLKRETKRALELTHPHIVRVYDWVSDGEHAAVCMEYVDGKALSTLRALKPSGVFEAEEIREWLGQLCEALEYAHTRAGVVHRDLKPQNLMINGKGELKVTDFGIARSLGETMTRTTGGGGGVSGSPGYMSPQQWQGKKSQPSDDLYSLGATIYELLTGKPPFYSGDVKGQTLEETPPSMAERREELGVESDREIPEEWEALVAACLAKESEKRPVNGQTVARALAGGSSGAAGSTTRSKARRASSSSKADQRANKAFKDQASKSRSDLDEETLTKAKSEKQVEDPAHESAPKHVPPSEEAKPVASNPTKHFKRKWVGIVAMVTVLAAIGFVWSVIIEPQAKMTARLKATAAAPAGNDRPWQNSLGMKFVPVPGTQVLFSVWETRVKDYGIYAALNRGVDKSWRNPGFPRDDNHPVVEVSWDDAGAFCQWLTAVERKAGCLGQGQEYRLPTDAEWSYAVGIGGRESGRRPKDKNKNLKGVYPWGTVWPPPKGAGNYAPALGVDDYEKTSPVGSFPANRYGLFDLGGNVREWCQDDYDGIYGLRVLRDASWYIGDAENLLSSVRADFSPDSRDISLGFRIVLAGTSAR